jgi:hypothetical protein
MPAPPTPVLVVPDNQATALRYLLDQALAPSSQAGYRADVAELLAHQLEVLALQLVGGANPDAGGERCHSCQAPVAFVTSQASRRPMILNRPARPLKVGVLVHADDDLVLADQATVDDGGALVRIVTGQTSHHARYPEVPACPAARAWQGRSRREGPPR